MTDAVTNDIPKPFLSRLLLMNYKSIASCSVPLSQFTVLVGPNDAGKSNLLDAVGFVADSLRHSPEYALRGRGGVQEVQRRSGGDPGSFGIRLDLNLPDGRSAAYAFQIGALRNGGFVVKREVCRISTAGQDTSPSYYDVCEGQVQKGSPSLAAAIEPDRLYLGIASGLGQFRAVYDALSRMACYHLSPERISGLQDPAPGTFLAGDGGNITSILNRIKTQHKQLWKRIQEYLAAVVPEIQGVEVKRFGPKLAIEFRKEMEGRDRSWRFAASSMSDGTLGVLGVLAAIFQLAPEGKGQMCLVGIEEPEAAVHPAASHVLASAFLEAAQNVQILITSHSPDLLDYEDITSDSILAVVSRRGETCVGPVDQASRSVLREGLYTAGELLRLEQIQPHVSPTATANRDVELFDV